MVKLGETTKQILVLFVGIPKPHWPRASKTLCTPLPTSSNSFQLLIQFRHVISLPVIHLSWLSTELNRVGCYIVVAFGGEAERQ